MPHSTHVTERDWSEGTVDKENCAAKITQPA